MAANPYKRHMPALGTESKVSGADRKKLRRLMVQTFPEATEVLIEAVLPAKAGELVAVKLAAPRRDIIYKLDGLPLLIDTSGKGDLVPTVFALWKAPELLPRVYLKHPAVSQYIVGGADVMLPGALIPPGGLPRFDKGQLLAVCVPGNPCPIAVGSAGMASEDAPSRKGGKLVEVLQAYGDMLWQVLGERAVPNDGFLADAVVPLGMSAAGLDATGYEEDENGQPLGVLSETSGVSDVVTAAQDVMGVEGIAAGVAQLGVDGTANGGGVQGGSDDAVLGMGSVVADSNLSPAGESAALPSWVPQGMDDLLQMTLLQALHRSVKDGCLPLTASVLWAQHMQPSRPAGTSLDMKKSSHKKLSAFLKAYGGKKGLLTLKEDKHSGDQVVTSVDRTHQLYTEFRPYAIALSAGGTGSEGSVTGLASATAGGGDGGEAGAGVRSCSSSHGATAAAAAEGTQVLVEEMWKPGKELRPVFEALGLAHDALYTAAEAGEAAFAYVAHAQLTQGAPDQRTIVLDTILCDALFKGLIKRGEMYPSHLPKSELKQCFLRRCSATTRISRGGEVVVRKGAAPVVSCSREKRQGHTITRILGVESYMVSAETVASGCQKRFASSCSVNELPGKNQGHEVVIQGNVTEHIAAFLHDKFGIPKRVLTVKH